ncbi:conserved hypothetical protein [Clavibacter michiganensis subsp. michiganensis NCPPB 382]|uniref:FtsK domain-containing protein n=1 Tax=Clavibacter michiganensis subsp. michiganensis (strain NCPPB 382) TaxID=443906 RepID=A5CTD2_CLAM3|nr:FtsK/SpoIIIE domain-containing protein [Clavibacter michiganensis]CAN02359.1 conserved hypothetical protein [Clavibacter michiganensis subsp. michiganensis NCPPB 382]
MLEIITPHLPLIAFAVAAVAVGWIGTLIFGRKFMFWKETHKWTDAQKEAFPLKLSLLEHSAVIELYAPTASFQLNHTKGKKKRKQWSWWSPYRAAVKAAYARPRSEGEGVRTLVRHQVLAAAASISVATLPDALQPANAGPEHFSVTLQLAGQAEKTVANIIGRIKSQLKLHSLNVIEDDDYGTIELVCHKVKPQDKLIGKKFDAAFLDANKAVTPMKLPLAVRDDDSAWALSVHHTLVIGVTGTGKGSVINGMIRQLSPFVEQGIVKMYGADPKLSELYPYTASRLFEELAFDNDDMVALIDTVFNIMEHRKRSKVMDLTNANLGRSTKYTPETPLIVLTIDEFLVLIVILMEMKAAGKKVLAQLTQIMAQGRSLGIYIVAAVQEGDKELLGRMRNNFNNVIVLRQPSVYFNDLFLGEGAAAAGYDSTKIIPGDENNGFISAGIGFVKDGGGALSRVRFAYLSDQDIAALILAHPGTASPPKPLTAETLAEEVERDEVPTAAELDLSWEMEEDPEPDEEAMPDLTDRDYNDRALPPLY